MLSLLSPIATAVNWWLIGSYRTGEFIVYTGISFIEMIINVVDSFNSLTQLLCEGSTLWFRDIYEYSCALNEMIRYNYDYSLEICSSILSIVAKAVYTPFSIITAILTSIRELLLLLGSSCLFLISLPPFFLFYSIDALLHAFKSFGYLARYAAERFTEHAADIRTLEALLGLVVGCGVIVLFIHAMKFLVKFYSKFRNGVSKALRITWRRAKTSLSIVKRGRQRQGTKNEDDKLQETELCIVCFENGRSVCFLPCRHLCLCVSCTESLSHPLRCPLCRQRAEDLIHVYL